MKVKPVSLSVAYDGHVRRGRRLAHYVMVDEDGGVHERIADMPPGKWATWEPSMFPQRAKVNRKTRGNSSK